MGTSTYFNSAAYNATKEQFLMEDLIIETIRNHGVDVYLIPFDSANNKIDLIYGEDPLKVFKKSFMVEMYINDSIEYTGARDFFAKFGLEVRDEATMLVARRPFLRFIPDEYQRSGGGPREGDLIWVPLTNTLLEIKHVEGEKDFYMLGRKRPYFFEVKCERFRYNNEQITTGLDILDQDIIEHSYNISLILNSVSSDFSVGEQVFQVIDNMQPPSFTNAKNLGVIVNYNTVNKTMNVAHTKGIFQSNTVLWGATTNSYATVIGLDDLTDNRRDDITENPIIENEASLIINFSENNPFGRP